MKHRTRMQKTERFSIPHKFRSSMRKQVSFWSAPFPLRKKAQLLQWVVFFSLQSHSEWSTFLTISYNSYLAYEVVFLHHLRNSTGPKGTPLEYFRLGETFSKKKFTKRSPFNLFSYFPTE